MSERDPDHTVCVGQPSTILGEFRFGRRHQSMGGGGSSDQGRQGARTIDSGRWPRGPRSGPMYKECHGQGVGVQGGARGQEQAGGSAGL